MRVFFLKMLDWSRLQVILMEMSGEQPRAERQVSFSPEDR